MRGLEVRSRPIFFDYSVGESIMPMGRVDLRSTRNAPWIQSCDNSLASSHLSTSELCMNEDKRQVVVLDNPNAYCKESTGSCATLGEAEATNTPTKESILIQGQHYFFEVVLTLPESEINKQVGVFMLTVDLLSDKKQLLATSKQSSMFPYESRLVGTLRKMTVLLPLVFGMISETRAISLLCFDNYVDANKERSLSFVEVSLGVAQPASFPATSQTIQILSAELRYGKEMNTIQIFCRNWRYLCAVVGVVVIFIGYTLLLFNMVRRREPGGAEPYAHMFDSANGSVGHQTGSQHSMLGADIEFLDSDDEWEPIDAADNERQNAKVSNKGCSDRDASDNVVSDEESVASKDDDNREPMHNQADSATNPKSFPEGNLAQNAAVQLHPPLFASADKEEKCLADMVMKGQAKYEVFTGKNLIDSLNEYITTDSILTVVCIVLPSSLFMCRSG